MHASWIEPITGRSPLRGLVIVFAAALLLLTPPGVQAQNSPPVSGLLGYWNFSEDTGTVAHDTSGNGYNGTVNGANWVAGYINSALSFDGTTNDVVTGNIAFSNAFSISAWVNAAVTPQTPYGRIAEPQSILRDFSWG